MTKLEAAIAEAERFLERARTADAALARHEAARGPYYPHRINEWAAMKRASLDLSRALADLRRRG